MGSTASQPEYEKVHEEGGETVRPSSPASSWRAWWFKIKLGLVVVLGVWNIMHLFAFDPFSLPLDPPPERSLLHIHIYRALGLLICWAWLWGCNLYIWERHHVPYGLIFSDLRPHVPHMNSSQVFHEAASLSVVFLSNTALFMVHWHWMSHLDITPQVFPLTLVFWMVAKLVAPFFPFRYWQSRKSLLYSLAQIFIAPCGAVCFQDFYVADILCSMSKILSDLAHAAGDVCGASCMEYEHVFVPLAMSLPYWWRFCQCLNRYYATRERWPHLGNALKYALGHSVVVLGAFHPQFARSESEATWHGLHGSPWHASRVVWLVATIVTTLYTFYWDVCVDWDLGYGKPPPETLTRSKSGFNIDAESMLGTGHDLLLSSTSPLSHISKNPRGRFGGLRSYRVFGDGWYYYVIASDLVLRYMWTVTLLPLRANPYFVGNSDAYFVSLLIFLELFRRFQWGVFRVERELSDAFKRKYGETSSEDIPPKSRRALKPIPETHTPLMSPLHDPAVDDFDTSHGRRLRLSHLSGTEEDDVVPDETSNNKVVLSEIALMMGLLVVVGWLGASVT